jgi:hypothetical protein
MYRTERPAECFHCGSKRIAKILYGMPIESEELERDIERGRIVLGGCIVGKNDPVWQCVECGAAYPEEHAE